MNKFEINCINCQATLYVSSTDVGKRIRCPKCQQLQLVQKPELPFVKNMPPLPTAGANKKVACACCGELISAAAAAKDKYCASCRGNPAEKPEWQNVSGYGFAGEGSSESSIDFGATLKEWWPTGEGTRVPYSWRGAFTTSRGYALEGRWQPALKLLNPLYLQAVKEKVLDAHTLNRPLAYCLIRWAKLQLRDFLSFKYKLTGPLRYLLKVVAEAQKWGRPIDPFQCPLCETKTNSLLGWVQLRTKQANVYTCCVPIDPKDNNIVMQLFQIHQKMELAQYLDSEVAAADNLTAKIPAWFHVLQFQEQTWISKVNDTFSNRLDKATGGILTPERVELALRIIAEMA
ncbi:MAG: hypothetical protein R3B84_22375 [Zavarzinella sp.]